VANPYGQLGVQQAEMAAPPMRR